MRSIEGNPMRKTLVAAILMATARTILAEVPQVTNYFGSLDGNLPVSMALDTAQAWHVTGSYVYNRYDKPISLAGSLSYRTTDHTDITLEETGPGTGTFELTMARNGGLSGTWKSRDGQRTLPVSLTPVARTITLASAKSDRYEVRTGYLRLTAQSPFARALNAHIEKSALDSHDKSIRSIVAETDEEAAEGFGDRLPYTSESAPFLLYASDTLVSIRHRTYSFTGGAHGSWGYKPVNYAWVHGTMVEIRPEMIVPESQWPVLRKMCIDDIKTQGAAWPDEIKLDQKTPPRLNFNAHGLLVAFDPYEASSYADGAYVVSLPYAKVKTLIDTRSPLAALASSGK
jgi:hypothetical protein